MLVLSRKQGQRIMIGPSIEVVVVETRHNRVRLGFNAPSQVPIHREEIFHRIERQPGGDSNQGKQKKQSDFFDVLRTYHKTALWPVS